MRQLWPWLYAGLFFVSLLSGAGAFGKEDLSHANIDWYFVAISMVLGLGFPFLAMWQSQAKKLTPSRHPLSHVVLKADGGAILSSGCEFASFRWVARS